MNDSIEAATHANATPTVDSVQCLLIPVSRSWAAVRGTALLICAALLAGGAWLIVQGQDWRLLWVEQKAILAAYILLTALPVFGTAVLGMRSALLLALAAWPGDPRIEFDEREVRLALGPYGRRRHDRQRLVLSTVENFDPDILDVLPDDALALQMRHLDTGEDLLAVIQRFGHLSTETTTRLFRPYLKREMNPPTVNQRHTQ